MPTRQRGTSAAVADCFEDCYAILRNAVAAHCERFGDDPEEAFSDAQLAFLQAYHTHDPDESDLEQRVAFRVPKALLERARRYAKRDARLHRVPVAPEAVAGGTPPEPETYSLAALTRRVGRDARRLLCLVFEAPPELDDALRADPNPGPESVRRHLRTYTRASWGWDDARWEAAFNEVADAI